MRIYDFDDGTTLHMISHMQQYGYTQTGKKNFQVEGPRIQYLKGGDLSLCWTIAKLFPLNKFQRLFLEYIIYDYITLYQSVSLYLKMILILLNNIPEYIISISHNTI